MNFSGRFWYCRFYDERMHVPKSWFPLCATLKAMFLRANVMVWQSFLKISQDTLVKMFLTSMCLCFVKFQDETITEWL